MSVTESQVIGRLLDQPGNIQNCDLKADEFTSEQCRRIYSKVLEFVETDQAISPFSIADSLEIDTGQDWTVTCLGMSEASKGIGDFEADVNLVRRDGRINRIKQTLNSAILSLEHEKNPAVADKVIEELMSINTSRRKTVHMIDEVVSSVLDRLEKVNNSDEFLGVKTGLTDLDKIIGGFHPTDLVILAARPAVGKAQPLNSSVLLSNGEFKRMGSVKCGDELASVDGKSSKVTGVYPQGVRNIYSMTLSDGRQVESDIEHLWNIESSRFDGVKTVTTGKLKEMLQKERFKNRVRLVGHNGDFGEELRLGIDPWLLGFLLGDGCVRGSSVRFSTGEEYILDKVRERLPAGCDFHHIGRYDYRITSEQFINPVMSFFRERKLDVRSFEKFIPSEIFKANKETRLEVLLGLLESDGWSQSGDLQFSSSSHVLAKQVQSLARSLGGSATFREKRNVSYVVNGENRAARDSYMCSICFEDMENMIPSPRVGGGIKKRRKTTNPVIRSIDFVREDLAQCIKVSHESQLYITDGYVVTHNTALALNFANSAASDKPVLFFSCEQGHDQIGQRMFSVEGGVDSSKMRNVDFEEHEWAQVTNAVHLLRKKKIIIADESYPSITYIIRTARQLKYEHDIQAIYVDYLQIIESTLSEREAKYQQVGQVARALKRLALELEIPVVVLAQVKREVDARNDKRPLQGDISDSSEIEKTADVIMTLYRSDAYPDDAEKEESKPGTAEILICKNRHGPTGLVDCAFIGKFMQFKDLDFRQTSYGDFA